MINRELSRRQGSTETSTLHRVLRYGPLLLWMIFITFASTAEFSSLHTSKVIRPLILWLLPNLTEVELAQVHFGIRKLGHLAEYGLLAYLASRAFVTSSFTFIRRRWFLLAALLVLVFSLLDEFHQSFVPSRSGSIYDCIIDMIGGLTVLLVFASWHRRAAELAAAERIDRSD